MDLFEHAEETRQQRLALTWSGKNEGTESRKVLLTKTAPQDVTPIDDEAEIDDYAQPAEVNSAEITEEPMPEPQIDAHDDTTQEQPQPVAPKSASIKLTKDGVVNSSIIDELAETVLDTSNPYHDEADITEAVPGDEIPVETILDDVAADPADSDLDEVVSEADDVESVQDVVVEDDDTVEEVIAAAEMLEDSAKGSEEDTEKEIPQAVGHDEGATTSMLAITPVELNDDYQDSPVQEKETLKMETSETQSPAPKPLKIARPAVALVPDPEDDELIMVATAKRVAGTSLKLTVPVETNTNVLKPKKASQTNNTCKLVPETSEIIADSLGGKLRAARELAGLTEFELAEKTRISSEYITALEREDFGNLPLAPIYIKSYLKTLSRQFGLNPEEMIEEYEAKTGSLKAKPVRQEPKETEAKSEKKPSSPMPKWLNWGLAAAAAVLAILAIAGIMVNKYGFGAMDENALAVISEAHLESTINDEFLEIRHMDIPQSETAAVND